MATMAERVWEAAGPTVIQKWNENPNYELILTGHSLGAGTACLLNIMLHRRRRPEATLYDRPPKGNIRCFAYASPPVFTPLEVIPNAVSSTTNYIHQQDAVPFLSVDSIRRCVSCLRVIDGFPLSTFRRFQILWGRSPPPDDLIQAVQRAQREPLIPKKGAPVLAIPAATSLWMKKVDPKSDHYVMEKWDPKQLSTWGIRFDNTMLSDHFPSRYEHALDRIRNEDFSHGGYSKTNTTPYRSVSENENK